jgi:hypothetical protein
MAKAKPGPKGPKKTTRKSPAKPAPVVTSGVPRMRVRMFRQGLGDCFLLTFDADGDNERHMLIDCGTLGNQANKVKIDDVAKHVLATIGDGKLAVVIATHEHKDHLSGFNGPMKKLQGKVEQVWLAWTENPQDPLAQTLAKNKRDLGEALAAVAATPLAALGKEGEEVRAQITDLLGFAGEPTLGAAKFAETINEAMELVRTGLGARTTYHKPGDLLEDPSLPGFRFYVLGPPHDRDALKDLGDHGSSELYGVSAGLRLATLFHPDAAKPGSPEEKAEHELHLPFEERFGQQDKAVKKSWYPGYFEPGEDWRKIDQDWLNLASDLALQLDSMTNNSSLALAIERVADGKVFLFPADAQQGNWLSWHSPELKFRTAAGTTSTVTVTDLLARTVFYKVGHHASHNATARGKGLELMLKEDELTAFIPVDRAVALTRNPKNSWQMPARPLYRRLLEKCQGRVVRSDIGWAVKATGEAANTTEGEFKGLATDAEWEQWGKAQKAAGKQVQVKDLFVEYTV